MLAGYLVLALVVTAALALTADVSRSPIDIARAAVVLAALGLHGRAFTTYESRENGLDFGGSGSFSFGFVPLLLLGGALALAHVLAYRAEKADPAPALRQSALRGALAAVTVAAALAVLALISHLPADAFQDRADETSNSTVGAAVQPLLLWGTALLALGFCTGRMRAWRETQELPALPAVNTAGVAPWAAAAIQQALLSGVFLTIAAIVYGLVTPRHEVAIAADALDNSKTGVVLLTLFLLPNIALAATGFFMGMSLNIGLLTTFGGDVFGLLHGDLPPRHYLWCLAPLTATLVVGVKQVLRGSSSLAQDWWRAGLGSLVVWAPLAYFLRVEGGAEGLFGGAFTYGFTAATVLLVSFGWGVLMLLLGLVAAGPALRVLPGLTPRVEPPAPPRFGTRRAAVIGTFIAFLLAATVGYQVADKQLYGSEGTVRDYLQAVSRGDVSEALTYYSATRSGDRRLLTATALPPGKRITDVEVGEVRRQASKARVEVSYRLRGDKIEDAFTVERSGHQAVLFHDWKISEPLGLLRISSGTERPEGLLVNGIDVDELTELPALPGLYEATVPRGSLFEVSSPAAKVRSSGGSLSLRVELSAEAKTQAQNAVVAYLRQCLAAARSLQTNCGVSSYTFAERFENVRWTLVRNPVVEVRLDSSSGRLDIYTSTSGLARVTGTAVQDGFFGGPPTRTRIDDTQDVYPRGTVRITPSGATFTPSP